MQWINSLSDCLSDLPAEPVIVMHSALAEPNRLAVELAHHSDALTGATIYTMFPMGPSPYADKVGFRLHTFVPGSAMPGPVNEGRAAAHRYSMSQLPGLFEPGGIDVDLLLLQLSPSEASDYSLGLAVDYMPTILAQRPKVIAEINPEMPYTFGDTRVTENQIDFAIPALSPPQTMAVARANEVEQAVAANVARLIGDGTTVQYGIGAIPESVLPCLNNRKNLHIHSGIITDPIMPLLQDGVVTEPVVAMAAGGSLDFYRFLHRNRQIEMRASSYTHGIETLSRIDRLMAINSCLQIDLDGRVNAERIGKRIISAPGGQPDFAAGAQASKGGANILAIRSTNRKGDKSSIVPKLPNGAPETVRPDQVDYLVTEYGIAELSELTGDARRRAIASVAHPDWYRALITNG